jgi:DNA-binding MarR family transcriptional regulator
MGAISTDRDQFSNFNNGPPILVVASSDAARARAVRTIRATGMRIAGDVAVPEARERIERQVSVSAVWLELDEDGGGPLDELLTRVNRDVANGRYAAVVSASLALIDPVMARIDDGKVELIIDADDAERAAALAIATSICGRPLRLSDVASDHSAERLQQLSDEVSRIAATLARLSNRPATAPQPLDAPAGELPPLSAEIVRAIIRARRLRARYFSEELFADPAWDMLLDLLQAEISQLRVPVSSLCMGAAVPATTALRWINSLVQRGLFIRRADPHDGRRFFVELAPDASNAMRRYFAEVGKVAVI